MFCKLFETEEYGQILAKFDESEAGKPELRIYIQPPDLGVCSISLEWPDTEQGWELAETALEDLVEDKAKRIAESILKMVQDGESIE